MWDENSIFPRIATGYAFTEDMNDGLVERFNTSNFTQGSALLKTKYYNSKKIIVQHIPFEEKTKKLEVNRIRNAYNIDTLPSVDIQEVVEIKG